MEKETSLTTASPAWGDETPAKGGDEESQGEGAKREAWGSQLEFILTCVGYAVGLGNVWRFPYLCFKNGGGAFLIPYVLMLIFVGLPVFYFELSFGQFASLGPMSIWSCNPLFKGVGYGMVTVSWLIGLSYNIVICYAFYYFFASMTDVLPWNLCEQEWNTFACITGDELTTHKDNATALNISLESRNLSSVEELKSSTEEYFYNGVLQISDGIDEPGNVIWQLVLCNMLVWLIVFLVLIRGISSLGKVVYFAAIFPYIMMTAVMIRGVTLPGASEGIKFYMLPDLDKLANAEVWSDAATQIFYSLSACSGGLIAMASYNRFDNNVLRDSFLVPIINCCTSIYAGFAIFSVLGFMAVNKGVEVEDVAESGPGLVFVVYPEGISQMPAPTVWAILFFFMLITLGFSSQFSIVEGVFSAIIDEFAFVLRKNKMRPVLFRACCIIGYFLITMPMVTQGGFYLFNVVDHYTGGFPLLIMGITELIGVQWFYGWKRFAEDYSLMLGKEPWWWFKILWLVVSPTILFAVIIGSAIQYTDLTLFEDPVYEYPSGFMALAWMIVAFTVFWIFAFAIYALVKGFKEKGFNMEGFKKSFEPQESWGPALPEHRKGRYAPKSDKVFSVQENGSYENYGYETEKL